MNHNECSCPDDHKHPNAEATRLCRAKHVRLVKIQKEEELARKLDEQLAKIDAAASKASAKN